MKQNIQCFNTEDEAKECLKRQLRQGKNSRLIVDPLAGKFPALSEFENVAIETFEGQDMEQKFAKAS